MKVQVTPIILVTLFLVILTASIFVIVQRVSIPSSKNSSRAFPEPVFKREEDILKNYSPTPLETLIGEEDVKKFYALIEKKIEEGRGRVTEEEFALIEENYLPEDLMEPFVHVKEVIEDPEKYENTPIWIVGYFDYDNFTLKESRNGRGLPVSTERLSEVPNYLKKPEMPKWLGCEWAPAIPHWKYLPVMVKRRNSSFYLELLNNYNYYLKPPNVETLCDENCIKYFLKDFTGRLREEESFKKVLRSLFRRNGEDFLEGFFKKEYLFEEPTPQVFLAYEGFGTYVERYLAGYECISFTWKKVKVLPPDSCRTFFIFIGRNVSKELQETIEKLCKESGGLKEELETNFIIFPVRALWSKKFLHPIQAYQYYLKCEGDRAAYYAREIAEQMIKTLSP